MKEYLINRLSEQSTFFGLATAVSSLSGIAIAEPKLQAAFLILTFVLGGITAATKEKGATDAKKK